MSKLRFCRTTWTLFFSVRPVASLQNRYTAFRRQGTILLRGESSPLCWSIKKYVLTIWSEHNYIFLHGIVRWVYNYMFRPCVLAIVSLYCELNKQLYNMCVGYCGENEISSYSSGWHGMPCHPLL